MINHTEELFSQMGKGAWIITPNNRLAQQLIADFFLAQSRPSIQKPVCLPYASALHLLFQQTRHHLPTVEHPQLLNLQQQQQLWREIFGEITVSRGLLHEVQEAWRRCQQWEIDLRDPVFRLNSQTEQFQQWAISYQLKLNQLKAITEEEIVTYLINHKVMPLPPNINFIWACFDDFTPQQRSLQDYLQQHNHLQIYYDVAEHSADVFTMQAQDDDEEQLHLMQWLKSHLIKKPQRIAVVVPDLQTRHQSLQRVLLRHFPAHVFNISFADPLKEHVLIAHALTWLQLDKSNISNQQLRLLLHSPFLAYSKTEFMERSQILHENRGLQENKISLTNLKKCLRTAPKLLKLLNSLDDYPESASPEVWIELFKLRLHAFGFPGEYPLSSASYQVYQRFLSLLEEFISLRFIQASMSKTDALNALLNFTETTAFQARKSSSPIQILGLLEASGCTFDSIWVCGMTDQALPQKTRLSSFIPQKMQIDLNMPHARPERELQFARSLVTRLTNSAREVVFSYACLIGDTPNVPSPLITNFPAFLQQLVKTEHHPKLQKHTESYLIPFAANETVSGGTALITDQAKCPFRAFTSHRLYAQDSVSPSSGLDARTRGQLLHKIMENLWRTLQNQTILLEQTPETLDELMNKVIEGVLISHSDQAPHSLPKLIQTLEFERTKYLVSILLDWEKQRPNFSVSEVEEIYQFNIAGLELKLRVDRIDQVGEKKWVIDYKTTLPGQTPWEQERPEEPQLLLYALLDSNITTLLFLELKNGRLTCKGLSEDTSSLKGISALPKGQSWDEAVNRWKLQLQDLSQEFQQGQCNPAPTRTPICQQCDYQNLCRIRIS